MSTDEQAWLGREEVGSALRSARGRPRQSPAMEALFGKRIDTGPEVDELYDALELAARRERVLRRAVHALATASPRRRRRIVRELRRRRLV